MNRFDLGELWILSDRKNDGTGLFLGFFVWLAIFGVLMLGIAFNGVRGGHGPSPEEARRRQKQLVTQCGEPCQAQPRSTTEVKRDWEQVRKDQLRRLGLNWQGKANWRELREQELRQIELEDKQAKQRR